MSQYRDPRGGGGRVSYGPLEEHLYFDDYSRSYYAFTRRKARRPPQRSTSMSVPTAAATAP